MELRAHDLKIVQEQIVGALLFGKALLVAADKTAASELQPMQGISCLISKGDRLVVVACEVVACLSNLRGQRILTPRLTRSLAAGKGS